MKLNKKKKGFTLIELMAVIAIVAILAAVLVPTVSGYIDRSKKTALITQVRNVVNAVEVYNSTAPTADKITNQTISQLTDKSVTGSKDAFIDQELLTTNDVTKLATTITYDKLVILNGDENAMNNISKKNMPTGVGSATAKKFVYNYADSTASPAISIVDEIIEK